jgi:hypothetical protein
MLQKCCYRFVGANESPYQISTPHLRPDQLFLSSYGVFESREVKNRMKHLMRETKPHLIQKGNAV